jgi:hypothetical protein
MSWRLRAAVLPVLLVSACSTISPKPKEPPPPLEEPPLPVKKAPEDVVVAAWSEPKQLPPNGGQAQILVRAQKRGGAPYPGVEVRVRASAGSLFSKGRVLITDASGQTRDRLTSGKEVTITVNAGGTVYRFRVPVSAPVPEPNAPD